MSFEQGCDRSLRRLGGCSTECSPRIDAGIERPNQRRETFWNIIGDERGRFMIVRKESSKNTFEEIVEELRFTIALDITADENASQGHAIK